MPTDRYLIELAVDDQGAIKTLQAADRAEASLAQSGARVGASLGAVDAALGRSRQNLIVLTDGVDRNIAATRSFTQRLTAARAEMAALDADTQTEIRSAVILGASLETLQREFKLSSEAATLFGQQMGKSGGAIGGGTEAGGKFAGVLGLLKTGLGALGIGLGVNEVLHFVDATMQAASEVGDLASKLHISVARAQEFKFAADQAGSSIQDVGTALAFMNQLLGEGAASTVQTLKEAGLEFRTIRAMAPEDAFLAITSAIKTIPDPMKQARLAVELFGRSGQDLLPAIRAGIADVGAQAALMSDQTVANLKAASDSWAAFKASVTSKFAGVLSTLVEGAKVWGLMKVAVDEATKSVDKNTQALEDNQRAQATFLKLHDPTGAYARLMAQLAAEAAQAQPPNPMASWATPSTKSSLDGLKQTIALERELAALVPPARQVEIAWMQQEGASVEELAAAYGLLPNTIERVVAAQKAAADAAKASAEKYKTAMEAATTWAAQALKKIQDDFRAHQQALATLDLGATKAHIALTETGLQATLDTFDAEATAAAESYRRQHQFDSDYERQRLVLAQTTADQRAVIVRDAGNKVFAAVQDAQTQVAASEAALQRTSLAGTLEGLRREADAKQRAIAQDVSLNADAKAALSDLWRQYYDNRAERVRMDSDVTLELLTKLASGFQALAQTAGSSLGRVAQSIGTIVSALMMARNASKNLKEAIDNDQGASLSERFVNAAASIMSMVSAMDAATASGSKAHRVVGGAMAGAQAGSAFGPWGTAIGAGIGALVGFFRGRNADAGRGALETYLAGAGGAESVHAKLQTLGAEGDKLWQSLQGKHTKEQATEAMNQVAAALTRVEQAAEAAAAHIVQMNESLNDIISQANFETDQLGRTGLDATLHDLEHRRQQELKQLEQFSAGDAALYQQAVAAINRKYQALSDKAIKDDAASQAEQAQSAVDELNKVSTLLETIKKHTDTEIAGLGAFSSAGAFYDAVVAKVTGRQTAAELSALGRAGGIVSPTPGAPPAVAAISIQMKDVIIGATADDPNLALKIGQTILADMKNKGQRLN